MKFTFQLFSLEFWPMILFDLTILKQTYQRSSLDTWEELYIQFLLTISTFIRFYKLDLR